MLNADMGMLAQFEQGQLPANEAGIFLKKLASDLRDLQDVAYSALSGIPKAKRALKKLLSSDENVLRFERALLEIFTVIRGNVRSE